MLLQLLITSFILTNAVTATPSVFQYTQTSPTYPIVCPGDRIVLTCIVTGTGGAVGWQVNEGHQTILISGSSSSDTVDSFFLNITESNSTTLISLAINDSASVTLDGANVSCIADGGYTEQLIIDVANPPGSVNTVSIDAINNSALFISWNYDNYKEEHCVSYNINVTANGTLHDINNSSYSNYTHTSLTIGTNYSFIIIPIDTIGREGPPSSLIQYIWNVPAQVVNISWDQISTDSITIWWNNNEDYIPVPPTQYYIINVYKTLNSIIYTNNTTNTNTTITGLPLTDTNYTVSIIPVNVIGYGPSATVNVHNRSLDISSSVSCPGPSSVISSYTPLVSTHTSHTVSFSTIDITSTLISSLASTTTPTGSTGSSTSIVSTSNTVPAASSNAVPIISGAIGAVLVIIIIIIIILIIILVYAKRHRIKNKESHTANGNGNEYKGVSGSSYRNNNIELVPTDPTYATPTTEYTPAAASTVRTLQGGDGPPSYPPPPPTTGQYSVLKASEDDDEVPPPVPVYNPTGVQEYSELRREGEKKNKQQQHQQQQQQHGAGPLYSTLNQDDTPPPVPPAYNPEGGQEYSVLKREGENKGQQGLSPGATGLYSTINKDTNNQVLVDESAHKPVYADLAIAAKGKRPQAAPTQEQPVLYASVNNKSVPPPIPPPVAPDKVLYADLSIAAGKRTPKNKPPTEERVVYAAVNGNRKSTTQELIMDRLGGLDIPPPIPPKPKP